MTATTAGPSTLSKYLHLVSPTLAESLRLLDIIRCVRQDERARQVWSEESLQHICERFYQPALGIADWVITVKVVPAGDIDGNQGSARILSHCRCATIKIAHPVGLGSSRPRPVDMEETLVHELLHVVMHRLPDSIPTIDLEQIIESISPCIVGLLRAGIQPQETSS